MRDQELRSKLTDITTQYDALVATLTIEDREPTAEERTKLDALLADGKKVKTQIERDDANAQFRAELEKLMGPGPASATATGHPLPLGAQFVKSDLYQELRRGGTRGKGWHSRSSSELLLATTLTEGAGSGGGLVLPQLIPGIVPPSAPPVVMAELFASGTCTSNAITYMVETVFTNAAAPTAEAAAKPESALTFAAITEPLRKIPTWLPVSNEILEDVPQMRSYVDARLRLGVLLALDNQLLSGDGTGVNLKGLLVRTDLSPALPMGTDTAIDAIAKQIVAVQNASQRTVDGIVLNPSDWLTMRLKKTTTGEYLSGSPFDAAQPGQLWGRTVAQTPMMPAGKALVGAFKIGGQLFTHGGVAVDASNSHQDYFVKNLVAIRAEIRAQLALYTPIAFGVVTGVTMAE